MDACINIFHTNAIYKHVDHDKYTNMYITVNGVKIFLLTKSREEKKE
jgi:hypothetical protein